MRFPRRGKRAHDAVGSSSRQGNSAQDSVMRSSRREKSPNHPVMRTFLRMFSRTCGSFLRERRGFFPHPSATWRGCPVNKGGGVDFGYLQCIPIFAPPIRKHTRGWPNPRHPSKRPVWKTDWALSSFRMGASCTRRTVVAPDVPPFRA